MTLCKQKYTTKRREKLLSAHSAESNFSVSKRASVCGKYSRWLSADPALQDYIPADAESAKKLPAGGVYTLNNLSLYHYSNNNPLKYKDPDGQYSEIVKSGNKVTITLPVSYAKGTTAEQKALFKAAAESAWSGQFGDYDVELTVEDRTGLNDGSPVNTVEFLDEKGASTNADGCEIKIRTQDKNGNQRTDSDYSVAHEVGHSLGLDDKYKENGKDDKGNRRTEAYDGWKGNIMAENPGTVDSRNIDGVLKNEKGCNVITEE